MSNFLVGNGKLLEQIPVLGKPELYGKVDVNVESLINRATKLPVIRKYSRMVLILTNLLLPLSLFFQMVVKFC